MGIAAEGRNANVEYCVVAALAGTEGFPTAPLPNDRETLSLLTQALSGIDPHYREFVSQEAGPIIVNVDEVVRHYNTRHKQ